MTEISAIDADKEFLMRRAMTKGYQLFSLLAPPCYIAWTLAGNRGRGGLNLNRVLRATWVGGALGEVSRRVSIGMNSAVCVGVAEGGAFEFIRSANSNDESIRTRRLKHAYDVRV
jgi:hypothetical protein